MRRQEFDVFRTKSKQERQLRAREKSLQQTTSLTEDNDNENTSLAKRSKHHFYLINRYNL